MSSEWKSTYDRHTTREAAERDMNRRQKWAAMAGLHTRFKVTKDQKGGFVVWYSEGYPGREPGR